MIDPISIGTLAAGAAGSSPGWLPWATAAGTAAAGAGSLLAATGAKPDAAQAPKIEAPPGIVPAQTPNARPKGKSQQQSFLSGAATAQQSGSAGGTGKTLLGA